MLLPDRWCCRGAILLPLYIHKGANGKRSFRFLAKSCSSGVSSTVNRFLCPAEAYTPRAMRTSSPLSTILESIQFMVLRVVKPIADSQPQRSSKENESFFVEYCNIRFLYVSILLLKYNFGCKDNIKTAIDFVYCRFYINIKRFLDVPQTICLNQANAASISLIGFYSLLVCF